MNGVEETMLFAEKYVSIKYVSSALKKRNEALSALLELSNFLSAAMEFQPLLRGALAFVLKHFKLDSGRIYLLEAKEQVLVLAAHTGLDVSGLERVGLEDSFSGKSARTKSFIAQHVSELVSAERAELLSLKGLQRK
jgi:hypothetical protein